jgi:site-specific recombinase XerD
MDASKIRIVGPLTPHVDGLWSELAAQGYTSLSISNVARLMAHLSRWLDRERVAPNHLNAEQIERFLRHRKRAGYTAFLSNHGLEPILQHLRGVGIVPAADPIQVVPTAIDDVVGRYTEYIRKERGVSAGVAAFYERIAQEFLPRDGNLLSLTAASVIDFVLKQSRIYSVGATKYRVSALRSLLRYLYVHDDIATNLVAAVPAVAGWRMAALPRDLDPVQVNQLLRSCDRRTDVGRRAFAALLLMVRLGLRAGEVATLELDDIDWRQGELLIRGKGQQLDRLPLPADVGSALASYLRRSRPRVQSRKVFLRLRAPHRGLSSGGVIGIVHGACRRAGFSHLGAHRLRHTAATQMLRHGSSLTEIAQVLRHRNVDTTAIYAKVDRVSLRQLAQPWPGGDV